MIPFVQSHELHGALNDYIYAWYPHQWIFSLCAYCRNLKKILSELTVKSILNLSNLHFLQACIVKMVSWLYPFLQLFVILKTFGKFRLSVINIVGLLAILYDDVIKWKRFPRYWPFVGGIDRSSVNSTRKGQWHWALMSSLICAWTKGWVNNRDAGDFRRSLWRHCNGIIARNNNHL